MTLALMLHLCRVPSLESHTAAGEPSDVHNTFKEEMFDVHSTFREMVCNDALHC